MCVIKRYTDVYPSHIRRRKMLYRCSNSEGNEPCSQTRVHDYGEVFHRYDPPSSGEREYIHPASLRPEVSTPERAGATRPKRRSKYKEFICELHLPFTGGRPLQATSQEPPAYGVSREHVRPVIISPNEIQPLRGRSEIPTYSQAQPNSPPLRPVSSLSTPASPREPEQAKARRPRERNPVEDRLPARRRPSANQSSPSTAQNNPQLPRTPRASSPENHRPREPSTSRRVRFSAHIEHDGDIRPQVQVNQSNDRSQRQDVQEGFFNVQLRARQEAIRDRERAEFETEKVRRQMRRNPPRPSDNSRLTSIRAGVTHVEQAEPSVRQPPPLIIQDGNRQIRDAGDRILATAPTRYRREGFSGDVFQRRHSTAGEEYDYESAPKPRRKSFGDERFVADKEGGRYRGPYP